MHDDSLGADDVPLRGCCGCVLGDSVGGDGNMSDLIDRRAAIDAVRTFYAEEYAIEDSVEELLEKLPSAEPKIIHCKDCRWWDGTNGKKGYCHAAKHGYYSPSWEIHIYRTHYGEFYCADAERRTDE